MKNPILIMLTILVVFFATLTSCEKDDLNNNNTPDNETYVYDKGSQKSASFFGQIVDENNNPLSSVDITIGNKNSTTDANGVFFIENAQVYENLAFVKAVKTGYFLGSRSIVPTDGTNNIRIMMLQKQQIGSFDAAMGGTVNGNGITIEFQDGVVDANGNAYTGMVNVAAKYIDPESNDFSDYMPGNLIAADANGNRYLKSYGMVAVELTDANGNELQPAEGKEATVSFPLSSNLLADAPNVIDLWHFSETGGYWVHEGTATLEGNVYKASVSHFSFWNCDIPTDYALIEAQVLSSGLPLTNIKVEVVSQNWGTTFGYTDNNGNFAGIMPANELLTFNFYQSCAGNYVLISSQTFGPFTTNQNLGQISILSNNQVAVSGTLLDCNNNLVSNGYVSIGDLYFIVSNGSFTLNVCQNTSFSVHGFDMNNFTESGVSTYNSGSSSTLNVGQIVACNSITEYIMWNLDGTDYIALNNIFVNANGPYAVFSGNTPNSINISATPFAGVGTYAIDGSSQGIWGESTLDSINYTTCNLSLTITQYGTNTGDLVEGTFGGTFQYNSSSAIHNLSGNIHFFRD